MAAWSPCRLTDPATTNVSRCGRCVVKGRSERTKCILRAFDMSLLGSGHVCCTTRFSQSGDSSRTHRQGSCMHVKAEVCQLSPEKGDRQAKETRRDTVFWHSSVQVVIRCRPLNTKERDDGRQKCAESHREPPHKPASVGSSSDSSCSSVAATSAQNRPDR